MSIVAPVAATAPVVPVVVGIALGELPSAIQAAGVAFAVTGIVVTAADEDPAGFARPRS
jgi:drug/metabolite transporter (DMT)-like permease